MKNKNKINDSINYSGSIRCIDCNKLMPINNFHTYSSGKIYERCIDCNDYYSERSKLKKTIVSQLTTDRLEKINHLSTILNITKLQCLNIAKEPKEIKCLAYLKYKRFPAYYYLECMPRSEIKFHVKFYSYCDKCSVKKNINDIEKRIKQEKENIKSIEKSFEEQVTEEMIQMRLLMKKANSKILKLKKETYDAS